MSLIDAEALRDMCDTFVRSLQGKMPETRGTYRRALREFVRWGAEGNRFCFQVEEIERYKRYLTEEKKLAQASVSTYLTAVRRMCAYLVDCGLLSTNPAKSVRGNMRPVSHSREPLSAADVERLLAVIDRDDSLGRRDFAVVTLMLDCGLLEIEVVRANVGDLTSVEGRPALTVQGKGRTAKDQVLVLGPVVKQAIDEYLASRKDPRPEGPLFLSAGNRTRGMRMTTRGIRSRVDRYLASIGIKQGNEGRITPYSLRHTSARMMARAGASVEEIQQRMRLGTRTTAMMYTK